MGLTYLPSCAGAKSPFDVPRLGPSSRDYFAHLAERMELISAYCVRAVARLISGSRAVALLNPLHSQVHVNAL